MLEFIILMIILDILMKIPAAVSEPEPEPQTNTGYEFKSLDDAVEYRELRLTGWKGNADDFYRWKEEE